MKKSQNIILLLLMTVLMICLAGCGKQQNQGTSVEISYLNKSETQIVTEEHYLSYHKGNDRGSIDSAVFCTRK